MDELSIHAVIARIRQTPALSSDPKLARFLQVTERTIANWKHGRNVPSDELAVQLAYLAGVHPEAFMAHCAAMRASTPESRERWLRVARQVLACAKNAGCDAIVLVAASSALAPT